MDIDVRFASFVGMEHLLSFLAHSRDINAIRVVKSLLRKEKIAQGSFFAMEARMNHMLLLRDNGWEPATEPEEIETYRRILAYARANVKESERKKKNPIALSRTP